MTLITETIVQRNAAGRFYVELPDQPGLREGERLRIKVYSPAGGILTGPRRKKHSAKIALHSRLHAEWLAKLLTFSVWSDEEIQAIEQTREYLNQWQPQNFF